MSDLTETINGLTRGDRVRFTPDNRTVWWTVVDRNADHVVVARQAAFRPRGEREYAVTGWIDYAYNYAGPGWVRSSLNTLGGGWLPEDVIRAIEEDGAELSRRRLLSITDIEVAR